MEEPFAFALISLSTMRLVACCKCIMGNVRSECTSGVFFMVRGLWIDIFHEKSGCRFVKDSDIVSGRICCLYYGHQLSIGIRVTAAADDDAERGGFRPERSRIIAEWIL